jgi:nucleoside-diphosphate-sugar epimerase
LGILLSKKVLVTGATGFVGSSLIKRLLQDNIDLTAAVLNGKGSGVLPADVARVYVQPLSESSDYSLALQNMDIVIHLAACVHIMQNTAMNPMQEFRKANLHGTERLARQAAQAGVKRFVFISTVKVLGEETVTPYREDAPFAPHDPYGTSKAEAETALWRIAKETGLEVVIVRPPLVYGPGVKANFRQLMSVVIRGVPLPFASIHNKRSLIYVGNLADVLACCATHPNADGQTYLVSDVEDVSTPELIQLVAAAVCKSARLFPFPPELMRLVGKILGKSAMIERLVGSLQVDSSKIRRELGWKPPITMEQGLAETAAWFMTFRA